MKRNSFLHIGKRSKIQEDEDLEDQENEKHLKIQEKKLRVI